MYYFDRIEPRKRLRLLDYDYQMAGYYYITLCTQNRQCLFGKIENDLMILNDAGKMVHDLWLDISNKYDGFENDLFVVMPNHLHGILILNGSASTRKSNEERLARGLNEREPAQGLNEQGPAQGPAPTLSVPDIMRNFKSLTTTCYRKGMEKNKYNPFEKKLWQRSYYEHIIRKNESLNKIRQYIVDNPRKWKEDQENPQALVGAGPCAGPLI